MPFWNIPGVYSEIDASAAVSAMSQANAVIGVVATATKGTDEVAYGILSIEDLVNKYGSANNMYNIVMAAMANGANKFVVVKVKPGTQGGAPTEADYVKALEALENEEAVNIVLTDSTDPLVHVKIKEHCKAASSSRKERIAIVGTAKGADLQVVKTNAESLNDGRIYTAYPNPLDKAGAELDGFLTAAGVAGQLAAENDPSMPMTSVEVNGFYGLKQKLKDSEISALIDSGVIPLEVRNGVIRIVRFISTYTKNAQGAKDITWQEVTTMRISDYIVNDLRNRISTKFARAKQSLQTREAIKSEVTTALLQYQEQGYIEEVDAGKDVSVGVNPADPFRNDVTFKYNVTGPVNVVFLKGYLVI